MRTWNMIAMRRKRLKRRILRIALVKLGRSRRVPNVLMIKSKVVRIF